MLTLLPVVSLAERVARVETETKTVRQVGQDMLRLQERLETEKATRYGIVQPGLVRLAGNG